MMRRSSKPKPYVIEGDKLLIISPNLHHCDKNYKYDMEKASQFQCRRKGFCDTCKHLEPIEDNDKKTQVMAMYKCAAYKKDK